MQFLLFCAAYALLLLVTLLVFGSVSGYLGRRRVILAGLAMAAGATGLFLAAHDVGLLFAARALHGAAVGTATSALGAPLIDLQPEDSSARRLSPPPRPCWAWPQAGWAPARWSSTGRRLPA